MRIPNTNRITNAMTISRMLNNINKNAKVVDMLYTQQATGKKIQSPADNPIIASRALKFRTNISMTAQFMRNVSDGQSWMKITEQSFHNTVSSLEDLHELVNRAATDSMELPDRQAIINQIRMILEQIGSEMNIQYGGRYVLSGLRTDEPPILEQAEATVFDITQIMNVNDFEKVTVYNKAAASAADPAPEPVTSEVYRLKLPYREGITSVTITAPNGFTQTYTSPELTLYGEIILDKDDVIDMTAGNPGGDLTLSYTKSGFKKGEINPRVYYDCNDVTNGLQYRMVNQDLMFEFGVNTRIRINSFAKDILTPQLYADLKVLCDTISDIGISTTMQLEAKYFDPVLYPGLTDDERKALMERQRTDEAQIYNDVMHKMFANMLTILERHSAQVSKEDTSLGSRMIRLNLIEERLEYDRVNYTDLMSENENVNLLEVLMYLSSAEAVYNASLQAGARRIQVSLADFVR